jgi:hypothetical protein
LCTSWVASPGGATRSRSLTPTTTASCWIGTPFGWGRSGEPVDIRLKGKRRPAEVHVFTDEAGVVEQYAVMARENHNFAKFNKISLDQAGDPSPADLQLAWAAGARAVRLTPW